MSKVAETLAQVPLFSSLEEDAVRRLDTRCIWRRAAAKEWVLDHESGGTDLFFMLQGHVRVSIAAAGREVILRDIRDGELAAIDQRPHSAGILAITDTLVARMPAGVFRQVVHQHADVCDQLLRTLVSQIRTLANRASEHSNLNVRQRLYAELAARVSSHREAITRELSALARNGLIERRRGAIALLDANRLREMVAEAGEHGSA